MQKVRRSRLRRALTPLRSYLPGKSKEKVRAILTRLSERDRSLLKAVFLDERDRDEVCREFGVEREYLRVLLHRAKQEFKVEYVKHIGYRTPLSADA